MEKFFKLDFFLFDSDIVDLFIHFFVFVKLKIPVITRVVQKIRFSLHGHLSLSNSYVLLYLVLTT